MFFIKDTYATIWNVEDKNTYAKGRISTSEKDPKNEGKYINSNWFVNFVGKAKDKAVGLPERTRIKILSAKISNPMKDVNGEKKSFLSLAIFDFELLDSNQSQNSSSQVFDSDELPF